MSEKLFDLEIRPGNVSVLVNGQIRGESSGCPRAILIRAYWGQPKVVDRRSLLTFAVGSACEQVVYNEIKQRDGDTVKNDVLMYEPVTKRVGVVGHADLVWKREKGFKIGELKSVQSTNSHSKYIVKGTPKITNIAQCVNYMVIAEAEEGELIYTSCLYADKVKSGDQRVYDIRIHTNGVITYDQNTAPFTVGDVLAWREYIADCLENKRLDPPPVSWEFSPFSVCSGCDYENVCEAYEDHRCFEQFESDVSDLLAERGRR